MYAPHASPARDRPAVLDLVDLALSDGSASAPASSAEPLISTVGVLGAVAALWVAYRLLRRRPNRSDHTLWFAIALCVAGLTALVPLAGALGDARGSDLATAVVVARIAVGALFFAGLATVLRPVTGTARMQSLLDVAIVWSCLTFATWQFTAGHSGAGISVPVATVQSLVLAAATVVAARVHGEHSRMAFSAAGIWVMMHVLFGIGFALRHAVSWPWMILLAIAGVAAPILFWRGDLDREAPQVPPRLASASAARTATITGAVAMATVVGLEQLVDGLPIGWGPRTVGAVGLAALGIRRLVGAAAPAGVPDRGARPLVVPAGTPPTPRPDLPARTDPLTGLATRQQLSLVLAGWRCELRGPSALLVIGLEGLADEPEPARDDVLREMARRLTVAGLQRPPGIHVAARLSTMRFAVLTRDTALGAYGLAGRLVSALSEPARTGARTVRLSACVGLTELTGASSTEDTLRRAELALVRARQLGPGRAEWYDTTTEADMRRQEAVVRDLPGALRRSELDLIYQPIMDLVQERPLAVEALLRWRHPQLGTVLPAEVIPVAEQIGVVGDLNHWVLGRACTQLRSWRREGHDLSMAINISPRHAQPQELAAELSRLITANDLPADRLVLEVAESAIEDGDRLACHLGTLRSVGVRTALDEFGVGPESLEHLRRVPIDMVKIGQSFFAGAGAHAVPAPPVGVIVGVGRRIGVEVVAQGLEVAEQLETIRAAGCRFGQGHYFARPQPAERTEAYLASFSRRAG